MPKNKPGRAAVSAATGGTGASIPGKRFLSDPEFGNALPSAKRVLNSRDSASWMQNRGTAPFDGKGLTSLRPPPTRGLNDIFNNVAQPQLTTQAPGGRSILPADYYVVIKPLPERRHEQWPLWTPVFINSSNDVSENSTASLVVDLPWLNYLLSLGSQLRAAEYHKLLVSQELSIRPSSSRLGKVEQTGAHPLYCSTPEEFLLKWDFLGYASSRDHIESDVNVLLGVVYDGVLPGMANWWPGAPKGTNVWWCVKGFNESNGIGLVHPTTGIPINPSAPIERTFLQVVPVWGSKNEPDCDPDGALLRTTGYWHYNFREMHTGHDLTKFDEMGFPAGNAATTIVTFPKVFMNGEIFYGGLIMQTFTTNVRTEAEIIMACRSLNKLKELNRRDNLEVECNPKKSRVRCVVPKAIDRIEKRDNTILILN